MDSLDDLNLNADPALEVQGVFLLKAACQNYAWGKVGSASTVAKFMASANPDSFTLDEGTPYAELWMGTHPKSPNTIIGLVNYEHDVNLKSYLTKHSSLLGQSVIEHFGKGNLPFLFKVLSVNKALSIQAHPNKEHAQKLHLQFPEHYPDKNHKPEMAIALTPFEGLCGFRPYREIYHFMKEVPELREVVSEGSAEAFCQAVENKSNFQIGRFALKTCFSSLYDKEEALIKKCVTDMLKRLKNNTGHSDLVNSVIDLLERLNSQFPGDVGIFCVFFLNRIILKPGQAMFLGPNEAHAYLAGECIECMACSDNVVRAGLTPKFKDVKTLCAMLNYDGGTAESRIFEFVISGNVTTYKPPVNDFAVQRIQITAGDDHELGVKSCASIMIVTKGEGVAYAGGKELPGGVKTLDLRLGSVVFIGAFQLVKVKNLERDISMNLYRAYCNV